MKVTPYVPHLPPEYDSPQIDRTYRLTAQEIRTLFQPIDSQVGSPKRGYLAQLVYTMGSMQAIFEQQDTNPYAVRNENRWEHGIQQAEREVKHTLRIIDETRQIIAESQRKIDLITLLQFSLQNTYTPKNILSENNQGSQMDGHIP